jgi:hypothetical protein
VHALHGTQSKGARIDAEIKDEETKELEKKEEERRQSGQLHDGTHRRGRAHN